MFSFILINFTGCYASKILPLKLNIKLATARRVGVGAKWGGGRHWRKQSISIKLKDLALCRLKGKYIC